MAGIKAKHQQSLRDFVDLCHRVGLDLEPFQKKIASALLGPQRETVVLLPRGQGKSRLEGTFGAFHLLTEPKAAVYFAANSEEQARIIFEYARDVALHPAVDQEFEVRYRELRRPDGGFLRVRAADAGKLLGLTPSLAILDEYGAAKDDSVYTALRTAVIKRPGARMHVVTSAGVGEDSPLARLRSRALAQPDVRRRGALTDARGESLRMLEWAVPADASLDDYEQAKRANPGGWFSKRDLREQRHAVHELHYRRFHLNQHTAAEDTWITAEAWDACADEPEFSFTLPTIIGVDASIRRDATAIATVQRDPDDVFHAAFRVWEPSTGHDVPFAEVIDHIREQARIYDVTAVCYDPYFLHDAAQVLEDEGLPMIEWRQDNARMCPATHTLHEAVVNGKLRHGGDPIARQHALAAGVKETERGLRIKKTASRAPDDAIVALAMGVEWASRQEKPKPPPQIVWV